LHLLDVDLIHLFSCNQRTFRENFLRSWRHMFLKLLFIQRWTNLLFQISLFRSFKCNIPTCFSSIIHRLYWIFCQQWSKPFIVIFKHNLWLQISIKIKLNILWILILELLKFLNPPLPFLILSDSMLLKSNIKHPNFCYLWRNNCCSWR